MKKIILALLLTTSFVSFAQTSNEERDPLNQVEIAMELTAPNSEIAISVYKTSTVLEKTFILKTGIKNCKNEKGIILKLSNGEVLKFKDAFINCGPSPKGDYILKGNIILTPELYNKLSQSEITEFKLGKTTVPVAYKEKNENLKALFQIAEQH